MKKTTVLFVGTLAALLAAGPGLAQTTKDSTITTKESTTTAPPAEKPSKLSMPHRVTGEVVSADASANTLTVKDSKGKNYTFKADSDAAARLSDLKAGDRVKVNYKKSHGEMVATKIEESTSSSTKTK
jgi:Cu/Ag efflux protein CusF